MGVKMIYAPFVRMGAGGHCSANHTHIDRLRLLVVVASYINEGKDGW
jgi:hypothetical protein